MIEMKIQKAKVMSIDDPDSLGKIQIKVIPEMEGVDDDLLPWVRPFSIGGMSKDHFSFNPPPVNSMVWVGFIDKYFKKGYYISGQHIDGFFSYVSAKNKADQTGDSNTSYPNLRFYLFEDGGIVFHNSETGNFGVVHNGGSYILVKQDEVDINGHLKVSV